ncbi:MAG: SDR family NAD(P)-dependent oxidoreductase [Actinobacteria bacterium]|nr:SDR family NAD(P)-dependent oxidoreductase [Actinomycetota bacterium]
MTSAHDRASRDAGISKAVLITGCSTGIGRATAEHFAKKGWTTYATARRPETLANLEAQGCRTLALDVNDETSMVAAVRQVEAEQGAVGVLVNNAGYSQMGPIEEVGLDEVRRQFETNVFGLVRMSQLVLPGMREQGWGRVINISSMGGKVVFPGMGFYHGTKFAVEAVSDAMRFETRGFGVKVVLVEPGLIRTAFADTATGHTVPELPEGSPYADFMRAVEQQTVGGYRGAMGTFATGPETVAKVIERAARLDRPRARYAVTAAARLIHGAKTVLPDAGWDLSMRSQFPTPRTAESRSRKASMPA